MPKRRVESALEHVSAESRRQWQERGVALRQFRNERSIQERRAASERAAGTGAGRGLAACSGQASTAGAFPFTRWAADSRARGNR